MDLSTKHLQKLFINIYVFIILGFLLFLAIRSDMISIPERATEFQSMEMPALQSVPDFQNLPSLAAPPEDSEIQQKMEDIAMEIRINEGHAVDPECPLERIQPAHLRRTILSGQLAMHEDILKYTAKNEDILSKDFTVQYCTIPTGYPECVIFTTITKTGDTFTVNEFANQSLSGNLSNNTNYRSPYQYSRNYNLAMVDFIIKFTMLQKLQNSYTHVYKKCKSPENKDNIFLYFEGKKNEYGNCYQEGTGGEICPHETGLFATHRKGPADNQQSFTKLISFTEI